ncbi:MAG: M20/M25/M40 family metallo-hydrolase [Vicinamibacterales bacterium]
MRFRTVAVAASIVAVSACAREAPRFSLENARAHVEMLADTIGSRPIGTPANARARAYIIDQLRLFGYDVRVQEIDARRPELGRTAHVSNIIATKAGADPRAIGLVSHYDSVPESPGAADDGLGVAVSLETARVLAARTDRRHTLMVLITDGEESGLMGAAGLVEDRDVMDRLHAYINVEAVGSAGTGVLFQAGPGNGWIVKPWARLAPHPRGGSYAIEIYRRLPNDTDFSIFERRGVPGLNVAPIGDSYTYHTARDTADRLSDATLRNTGENVVATATGLDRLDLSMRSTSDETYFDIGQTVALVWNPLTAWLIAATSLVFGLLAWFKVLGASVRLVGLGHWILDAVWSLIGAAAVVAVMVGGTWALRESRSVYHPWYAYPDRLFLLLLALAVVLGWSVARIGAWLPARAHGARHPMLVWSVTLPLWIAAAAILAAKAPTAGYLWTLPLLVAGAGLLIARIADTMVVRIVSLVVLAVAGTLWLRETWELLDFAVAVLGRLPFITPVWVYAALMAACGLMVVPPFLATVASTRPFVRPSFVTALLLIAVVVAGGLAYAAPAYTYARPQHRDARVIVAAGSAVATYEVASQEPGLDLDPSAPRGWYRATDVPAAGALFGKFQLPYVFRTTAATPGPPPASVSAFAVTTTANGAQATMTITPREPGITAAIVLPDDVRPLRSTIPGIVVGRAWRAAYVNVPMQGFTWEASFDRASESRLASVQAIVLSSRFPGGVGWQSLPSWLPQDHEVWHLDMLWMLPVPAPMITAK